MPSRCYQNQLRIDKKCGNSYIPDDAECNEGQGSSGKGSGLKKGLALAAGVAAVGAAGAGAAYTGNQLRKRGKMERLQGVRRERNNKRIRRNINKEHAAKMEESKKKKEAAALPTPTQTGHGDRKRQNRANMLRQSAGRTRANSVNEDMIKEDSIDLIMLERQLRSLQRMDEADPYDIAYLQVRYDKKCGQSYIPDDAECKNGQSDQPGKGGVGKGLAAAAAGALAVGAAGAGAVKLRQNKLNKGKAKGDKTRASFGDAAKSIGKDIESGAKQAGREVHVAGRKARFLGNRAIRKTTAAAKNAVEEGKQAAADIKRGGTSAYAEGKEKVVSASKKVSEAGTKALEAGKKAVEGVKNTAQETFGKKKKKENAYTEDSWNDGRMDVASLAAAGQMMLTSVEGECGCRRCRNNQPCSCE